MKIKVLMFTAVLVTAVFALGLASPASAQTYPDCTILSSTNEQLTCVNALLATCLATPAGSAQINCLTYVVAQMQAIALKMAEQQQNPTPAPTPVPPVWCHDFTINMGYAQSGNAEVGYLHTALDKQGISYAPDTGNAYSAGTAYAVSVFQGYYGIYQSGYVGEKTRGQLNVLYGCTPATVPYVLITLPNGGETLIQGQQYTIRWNSYGLGNVNIAASDPVTHAKYYLATVLSSTGYYVWTVGNYLRVLTASANPPTLPLGTNWQIEIYTGANPDDVTVPHDYSNSVFSIVSPSTPVCTEFSYGAWTPATCPASGTQTRTAAPMAPTGCAGGNPVISQTCTPTATSTITITSPNGGENWKIGELHYITWNTNNFGNLNVSLDLVQYNSTGQMSLTNIINNIPNSGSYAWTIPTNNNIGVSSFKILAGSFDVGPSAQDYSDNKFTISAAQTAVPGGTESIGLYDPTTSIFYLRNTNTAGNADMTFGYGVAGGGWKAFSGDWNGDSTDTVGLYDPATSTFHLRNSNEVGTAENTFGFGGAGAGWLPIAGDWNGDGTDTVGLYDPQNQTFYLKNSNTSGYADLTFAFGQDGVSSWLPIAGDWNGDWIETVGLYDPASSHFYLKNSNATGTADMSFGFGTAGTGQKPLAGDWNNNAIDTVGLYDPATSIFYLRNTNTAGYADLTFGFGTGGIGWTPLPGDWNVSTQNQPSITVTSPNGGETWRVGETHNITWRSYGLNADIKIKILLIDSGSSSSSLSLASNNSASSGLRIIPIPTSIEPLNIQKTQGGTTLPTVIIAENISASAGTYSWSIPTTGLVYSDYYKIKIETTTPSVADVSDNKFSIDPAPAITVLSPNGGETWTQGNAYDIRWYASGIGNVNIYLQQEDGLLCYLTNVPSSQGSYSYTLGSQCPDNSGKTISVGKYKILVSEYPSSEHNPPSDTSDNYFAIIAAGPAADLTVGFGQAVADWVPVVGDWNGDLTTTVGVYDPPSQFYLKNTNTTGVAELSLGYGEAQAAWKPIAGKWTAEQSGITIGLYDPTSSTFYLRNSNTTGYADTTFGFGQVGWLPITGDWNGDGVDTIGLYDPLSSTFYLRNGNSSGYADDTFGFGSANLGWLPVAGDWDGNGIDTIGLYDPSTSTFYLRNSNSTGYAQITLTFGTANSGMKPVAGDWDGNGTATVGLYDPLSSVFYLKNSSTQSAMISNASTLASLSEAVNMMLQEILALIAGR